MDGFQYNGIHCSQYHVWYTPDEKSRWFPSPDFEVFEQNSASKSGGYYYGSRTKIRAFTLKCFYEDINDETRENIRNWLAEGIEEEGALIFDIRPFATYYVRVTKVIQGTSYASSIDGINTLFSGQFEVTFSAYQPYGLLNKKYYQDIDYDRASEYCGILEEGQMPPAPTTTSNSFLLYNCGTQKCSTILRIGGSGTNITLLNEANGTKCVLNSLPENGYLEINSMYNTVYNVYNNEKTMAYIYHDDGYLTLAPYLPRTMNVTVSYTSGSTTINYYNINNAEKSVGRYIYIDSTWKKITAVDEQTKTMTTESAPSSTSTKETMIVTMNKITITGTDLSLSKLEIDYNPMIV